MAYEDPRLVELYDIDNPDGPDHDFYRSLADEIGASTILDVGCGTGMLTVSLAAPGRDVVGVDPSAAATEGVNLCILSDLTTVVRLSSS